MVQDPFELNRTDLESHNDSDCNLSLLHFAGIKYLLEKCHNFSSPLQKALIQVFEEEYEESQDKTDLPVPLLVCILAMFIVMILFGTLGSTLVILVVVRKPAMRSRSNMFIMNLAISDLTLCIFTEPFNLFQILATNTPWNLGSLVCKLLTMFQATNIFVSTISITAIALDRFQCIIYPTMPNRRPRHVAKLLVLVWIVAFTLASPLAFFSHVDEVKVRKCTERTFNRLQQKFKVSYYVAALVFQYVVPLLIVSVVYWRICLKIRNRHSRSARQCRFKQVNTGGCVTGPISNLPVETVVSDRPVRAPPQAYLENALDNQAVTVSGNSRQLKGQNLDVPHTQSRCGRVQRENRPILLLSAISVVFGLSWLPLNILNVCMEFREMTIAEPFQLPGLIDWINSTSSALNQSDPFKDQSLLGTRNVLIFQTFCLFLVLSSACFNPVLYGWLNENFRVEFRNVFCTPICRRIGKACTVKSNIDPHQYPGQQMSNTELNNCVIQWVLSPPYYSSCRIESSVSSEEIERNAKSSPNLQCGIPRTRLITSKPSPSDPGLRYTQKHSMTDFTRPTNSSPSGAADVSERLMFVDSESDRLEIERINETLLRALSESNDGQDTIPEVDPRSEQQNWCSVITAV